MTSRANPQFRAVCTIVVRAQREPGTLSNERNTTLY